MDTPGSLAGRVVLVTGGAQRVGAEIVRTLHAAGARVAIHYNRSAAQAEALAAHLNAARAASALTLCADLLEVARLHELVESTTRAFGRLDVLVNNASTFYPTPLGEITEAHWNDLLGSNLKAPLFLSQAAASALRLSRGLILNIVDIHGMRPLRRYPVYGIAKAGLIMLTKSLARELGPHVRVNAIAPGPVMWPADGAADTELQKKIVERTLLKRTGSAQDIARTALFFAADAPYVTGQVLAVDGGRSVGW
ncbi:MAG: pteridine reductase [Steroidobacteraceae bacterium]|jgi:pteridine reductase|nr:pteridine reductase [Steroidobacteraceae bacterium]